MSKREIADVVGILLNLDRVMYKDLMKLEETTLNKIYAGYIENARQYNHQEDRLRDREREIRQLKHTLQSKPTTG